MMKNRVLLILLTIILSFSLAACRQSDNDHKGKDMDEKDTTESEEETTEEAEEETTINSMQQNVEANVEEARFARDMTMLSELRYAIILALSSDYLEELKVNPNPVQVNDDEEINIAELFDTSNKDGEIMVEEVEAILGTDKIHFTSKLKDDCTLQIVELDIHEGRVVVQLISEEHELQYYFDYGQQEGIYEPTEDEEDDLDIPKRPILEDYGEGEITIWVPYEMVDIAQTYADRFLESDPMYSGYTASVTAVDPNDVATYMVEDPDAGADLYVYYSDQLPRVANAGATYDVSYTYYEHFIVENNDIISVNAATDGKYTYSYPLSANTGYFLYYDKSVISDPTSLEAIIEDCEAAGKDFAMELGSGWYQSAFFFSSGSLLEYEMNSSQEFTDCNLSYDSDMGVVALREMAELASSPSFRNSSNVGENANEAALVSGIWNKEAAMELFGDNFAVARLPEYVGSDGVTYQMSGFCGYRLLSVKPQFDQGKAILCLNLAEYLSSMEVQMKCYESLGWIPTNVFAQNSNKIKTDEVAKALLEQQYYSIPQRYYPGSYWENAQLLGYGIVEGAYVNLNDTELMAVLKDFVKDCENELNQ